MTCDSQIIKKYTDKKTADIITSVSLRSYGVASRRVLRMSVIFRTDIGFVIPSVKMRRMLKNIQINSLPITLFIILLVCKQRSHRILVGLLDHQSYLFPRLSIICKAIVVISHRPRLAKISWQLITSESFLSSQTRPRLKPAYFVANCTV